ncbi:rtt102p [Saccharomyces arboricola H-6]|uniref:Rtt102p n=1 Tax=Saccharomyces arboricola (strain H-6 / AS 2.3317 / CBS 10644) TaxID=1160507 RepID=J8Q1T5_SACAR|nr:rtt102p [Saccharomyces arboricola H-6]
MDAQTLILKANKVSYYGSSTSGDFWRYDWYQPSKTSSSAQQPQQQAGNLENSLEKCPFKYKAWLKTQENEKGLREGNCEDILDLTQYDRTIQSKSINPSRIKSDTHNTNSAPSTNQEGEALSMDDIRGAVGNSEAIPGLSAGTNNEKPEESKDVDMS